jgi:hypothetical protein
MYVVRRWRLIIKTKIFKYYLEPYNNVIRYFFIVGIVKQRALKLFSSTGDLNARRLHTACNNLIICTMIIFLEWTSLVSKRAFCVLPDAIRTAPNVYVLACRIGNQWKDERNAQV